MNDSLFGTRQMITSHPRQTKMISSTLRRLHMVTRIFSSKINPVKRPYNDIVLNNNCSIFCRHESTLHEDRLENGRLKIGEVERTLKIPQHPEYVPVGFLTKDLNQNILSNLKWMLQKDELGQDVFLIGRPSRCRRWLAMAYSQLTQREIEFVSISRDTTEADLKQRREIIDGSVVYVDQSAVRAAIKGRILILEGIEKAERNVLPVLNNLLENREMHLEDGKFLIAPKNYDKLLQEYGQQYLDSHNLFRVHDDFRVIALGIPVPTYVGNPLDPPLRSRFQARDVNPPQYWEMRNAVLSSQPNTDVGKLDQLLSCGYALVSEESRALGIPDFPTDHFLLAAKILALDNSADVIELFTSFYPFTIMFNPESRRAVSNILKSFRVKTSDNPDNLSSSSYLRIVDKKLSNAESSILYTNTGAVLEAKTGLKSRAFKRCNEYIPLSYHDHVLVNLLRLHAADTDVCIVGPPSSGKSMLIEKFAEILNYDVEPITLYQDMTGRDLIQQRETLHNGDTIWRNSPLVNAALQGSLALLDGLHRVHSSTLSFLQRLISDREIQLHDGQRLIRHDKYDYLSSKYGCEYLQKSQVHRIHPAFRIIALAQPPGGHNTQWLTSEILTFFPIQCVRALSVNEERVLIEATIGKLDARVASILNFVEKLRSSADPALVSIAASLSTRQLLRMSKRFVRFSTDEDVHEAVQQACLAKFLPSLTRKALDTMLLKCGIRPSSSSTNETKIFLSKSFEVNEETVMIGDTVVPRYKTGSLVKVPNVLFYDSPQHLYLLKKLLQDFAIGEHLLLVGNQGVGKNKLTDKLLQILNRPREYIQLHRDSTVQSLTIQPTIIKGKVKYEDSPLLKAVQYGHVLIVDEADKAPTHVTCVLKSLVESGDMILSDGRRIVGDAMIPNNSKIMKIHPDFRMILLANRPGFPFLGNNLFVVLGDLFSCHVIDNPSPESEVQLLKSYAPDVSNDVISKIIKAFGHLRDLADKGLVAYPYSTREAVNVVKHLQAFPTDDLGKAVSNVFDFDRYSNEMKDILVRVLNEYDINVEFVESDNRIREGENLQLTIKRDSGLDVSGPKHGKVDEIGNSHVGGNTWAGGTGGRDTAGLGGKGGPYRLDAGHNVHQLSDEEKNAVPEHVKKAAREMGLKAFKERLKEIKMSEYDAKLYNEFSSSVQNQVRSLRVLINNLQAKSKERQWSKHQTSGELDDTKLIEGITGARNVYKRRTDVEPELGAPQMKPKRLKLVVDVSGSMYRFNSYDSRLDREMEAVIMVMEAFQGYENKIQYDICGHSGEEKSIVFVSKHDPPTDNKQRLEVIKTMHAHAQFCMSGDHTLEATKDAIKKLEKECDEFDEGIVVILSDANLSRYRIDPRSFTQALEISNMVDAYVIFIGSLGDEAARLTRALPAGRGFVCMNLKDIPQILGQIFTSSLLRSSM